MRRVWFFVLLAAVLSLNSLFGQATVTVVARSKSLQLQSSSAFYSASIAGPLYDYFTTFDGSGGFPMHDTVGSYYYFSGELRPRAGQPGVYETDFITYSYYYGFLNNYGTVVANLPTTDSNGNGVPDFMERQNSCNLSFSGTTYYDQPPGVISSFTGTLTRSAGSTLGSYTVYFPSSGASISGTWAIGHVEGAATYTRRASSSLQFNLTATELDGTVNSLVGSTTFAVNGANQITLAPFTATESNGATYRTSQSTTLVRSGTRFVGSLNLDDGNPQTSWQDFKNWSLEITDTNDYDGNGIPNISDSPARPTLSLTKGTGNISLNLNHQPNQAYVIEFSTDLKTWSSLTTIVPSGSNSQLSDAQTTRRFYRVRTE